MLSHLASILPAHPKPVTTIKPKPQGQLLGILLQGAEGVWTPQSFIPEKNQFDLGWSLKAYYLHSLFLLDITESSLFKKTTTLFCNALFLVIKKSEG